MALIGRLGGDFRNSKPHYACLQLMWRKEIIEYYKRQSWILPSDKFEAHHIIPLDYSGEAGWGSGTELHIQNRYQKDRT